MDNLELENFAIVSCKDKNNPNFQIWGALSDLNCRRDKKKKIRSFKDWVEEREINEELTKEQNQGIKKLYVLIRDVLGDLKNQMIQNGMTEFDHDLGAKQWASFCSKFRGNRLNGQWQTLYKAPKNVIGWANQGCGIEINLPEDIKETFKNIRTPFYLRFPYEEDEIGGLSFYQDGTTNELRVSLKHLAADFDSYKNTIQHELQHLVDPGSNMDYSQNNLLLRTMNYLCHPGEIAAYAKEWAYNYYKIYPQDSHLDFEKFKRSFYKNGTIKAATKGNLDNYINFGEDQERLVKKYGAGPEEATKMSSCYKQFLMQLQKSFLYFKQSKY